MIVEFGKVETVFDYSTQHCPNDPDDFPDMPIRALLDKTGKVQVYGANFSTNRRKIGNTLSDVSHDCQSTPLKSALIPDITKSADYSWLMSPYIVETNPSLPIMALVHNEFHGYDDPKHGSYRNCSITDDTKYLKCWWGSVTHAVSYDNGVNFQFAKNGAHLVSTVDVQKYAPDNKDHYGVMEPSNIVFRSGFYYALVTSQSPTRESPFVRAGTCLMRTNNLLDAKSWKYWDGKGFTTPAIEGSTCSPVMPSGWSLSLTYNSYLQKYISLGCQWQSKPCMRVSEDLITWSPSDILLDVPEFAKYYVYGSILQPGDQTRNFEQSDRSPWLYYVSCGSGINENYCSGPDRNVKRIRIRFNKKIDYAKHPLLDLRMSEILGQKTLDASFYGNDASLVGDAVFSADTAERFVKFNKKGYLTVPQSSSVSIDGSFSITARLRTSGGSEPYATIINKPQGDSRNYGLFLSPTGTLHFSIMNNGAFSGSIAKRSLNDGAWHDIIVSYDAKSTTVKYFIDNQLDETSHVSGSPAQGVNSSSAYIGVGFEGDISSLTLYNHSIR